MAMRKLYYEMSQIIIGSFDGSDLIHLELFIYILNEIKSHAQDGFAQEKIKMDMFAPLLMKIGSDGKVLKEVNSSNFKLFFI
jgi:hypothetical protein